MVSINDQSAGKKTNSDTAIQLHHSRHTILSICIMSIHGDGADAQLSGSLMSAGKQNRLQRAREADEQRQLTASCPAFADSPSLRASHYMPNRSMRPSSWHIHSDKFSVWPYISSDYDLERKVLAKEKRAAQAKQVSDKDFIVPQSILPLQGLCCFSQLEYDLGPYPVRSRLWL